MFFARCFKLMGLKVYQKAGWYVTPVLLLLIISWTYERQWFWADCLHRELLMAKDLPSLINPCLGDFQKFKLCSI